jgi:hypothetical protein
MRLFFEMGICAWFVAKVEQAKSEGGIGLDEQDGQESSFNPVNHVNPV